MDDNISPEPFLNERREMRSPLQVTPSTSTPKEDDVETGSSGTKKLLSSGSKRVDTWPTDERSKGGVDTSDHPSGRHARGMSFMPRHHKSEVNPFINRTMSPPWHLCVKMAITGSVLLPLRLAFSMLNFLVMWFFASIVLAGLSEDDMEKSFSRWRNVFKYPICWCLRFQCFLFGFLWIRVKGKCAKKEEAPIIVSNHVSPFEPFFLVSQTQATPVQRIEDSRAPVIGKIQKAMQVIFVDRSNPASKKKCLKSIEERSDPNSRFPRVLVFPEGTCTNQRALITFKRGPFLPGKPIQPVIVRYKFWWLDPSFPAVSPSLLTLALRVMCQVWNCMEIEYLPVYMPSPEDQENPTLFAQHVQEYMSRSLGVPATQHAFEDVALQFQAMKLKLNPEDAVVEWSRVRRSLDIDTNTAKEYLVVFFEMDTDRDGRLSREEFCGPWKRKRDAAAQRRRGLAMERTAETAVPASASEERAAHEGNGSGLRDAKTRDVTSSLQLQQDQLEGNDIVTASLNEPPRPDDTDGPVGSVTHVDDVGGHDRSCGSEVGDGRKGGKEEGKWKSGEDATVAAAAVVSAAAAALDVPGLLRKEEIERAYDIFCGGEELDFQRFLTGLGVLSGLAREGRTGLFKFIFSVLQGRRLRPIYRRDIVAFIRRLRPDVTQDAAEGLLDKVENLGKGDPVEKEGNDCMKLESKVGEAVVTRESFVAFAEQNGSIISVYQAMLLNDILGVEHDIAQFGMTSSEDFGSLGVDTTELEKSLHGLVGPAALV